jgi:hypothetical protein
VVWSGLVFQLSNKVEFYKQAMIQQDVSLEIEDFEKFYDARKSILAEKIRELLG